MQIKFLVVFAVLVFLLIVIVSGTSEKKVQQHASPKSVDFHVHVVKENWFDSSRNRVIPIALFLPEKFKDSNAVKLVVFSHGYGSNYPLNYLNYSYLTKRLAAAGFWVLSIQHELKTDDLLPTSGNIQQVRLPFWERGMQNILFAIEQFKQQFPNVKISEIDAVGHSNGGDMIVFTAIHHPDLFQNVVTLDHLRVALPLSVTTRFTTLRSTDKQADPGVLPDKTGNSKSHIQVIHLVKIKHNDMNDEGTRKQHKQINKYVMKALQY